MSSAVASAPDAGPDASCHALSMCCIGECPDQPLVRQELFFSLFQGRQTEAEGG